MSEAFLAIGDFNVIAVDWGGGSASLYSQSAANTRLVGLEVAYLINFLKVCFLFNFLGIICRLWLSFSTARIMAEVVNKTRDRNVRDSTLDSLCCRCCHRLFFSLFWFFNDPSCLFSFLMLESQLDLNYRHLFSPIFWLLTESRSRTSV